MEANEGTWSLKSGDQIILQEKLENGLWRVDVLNGASDVTLRIEARDQEKSHKREDELKGLSVPAGQENIGEPRNLSDVEPKESNSSKSSQNVARGDSPVDSSRRKHRLSFMSSNVGRKGEQGSATRHRYTMEPRIEPPKPPAKPPFMLGKGGTSTPRGDSVSAAVGNQDGHGRPAISRQHSESVVFGRMPGESGGCSAVYRTAARNLAEPVRGQISTPVKYQSEIEQREARAAIKEELKSLRMSINEVKMSIHLAIRAGNDNGLNIEMPILFKDDSPEQKILKKMLESPFSPIFEVTAGSKHQSFSIAPNRPVLYSEILLPNLNCGSIPEMVKNSLKTLEFNVFPIKESNNEHEAYLYLMNMFYDLGLIQTFNIPEATLYRFLVMVARKYRFVPFHNFYHAFNVTQTMYYFIKTCKAEKILGPLEELALLVGSLSHDCDHPGLNNDFQRKAQTRIYHMHKKSVLENHHYLTCMSLLAEPETDIFVNLNQEQEDQIYIYLRDLILATDLAVHGIILKTLTEKKKVLAKHFKLGTGYYMSDEDRKLLMLSLIKCADLSNEVRQDKVSKQWAKLVIAEFIAQSDKERLLNLPVTPFMDRDKIIIAQEQVNFIEKLCLPLYTQLAFVLPELEECCETMNTHKKNWHKHLKAFFANDPNEVKKLSNKSIWERKQAKAKGSSLSSTLAMRATNTPVALKRHKRDIMADKDKLKQVLAA
ncbi:high affinity cGMP-specific 3',5'-cyclic phosphodiesterase 9A-like [Schistocerca gregaria]|uniref:high affinity cGMP-specific 3',5'-cyclic phosphodiesterase 9A-like n=1 Tax=Schistocerca gregaria TaxID=7010 RepID=UPI00211E0DC9|nr:high affinity cGMP-specific 3',5'-cyclic phosphodiesterase 9A-like [Schistocerca gregaria]